MTLKLSKHISKIAINDNGVTPENWRLTNVKQINLFIGPNNSGKSREIRDLFNSINKEWFVEIDFLSIARIKNEIKVMVKEHDVIFELSRYNIHSTNIREIISNLDTINDDPIKIDKIANLILNKRDFTRRVDLEDIIHNLLIDPIVKKLDPNNEYKKLTNVPTQSLYIPTLRSLRNLGEEDVFEQRTISDYFGNKLTDNKSIFTGHSLYNDLVEHLLGTHEQRDKVRKYEEYLSVNFFLGQSISLVPMVKRDVVYFKEGDKEERPIYDLGDGIQSIIILTFPIFMAQEPTLFFIEEPEHYLHAGLQRTLIETIAKQDDHIFFMTTHSNHFLDLVQEHSDISIQSVSQEKGNTVVKAAEFIY